MMKEEGTFELLPKKQVLAIEKEMEKLEKNLGGIKDMDRVPSVLVVVDPGKESTAVTEAKKLGIPVVSLIDTNCNPEGLDFVIPGNDDAIRSIALIMNTLANAIIEGRQGVDAVAETEEIVEVVEENK